MLAHAFEIEQSLAMIAQAKQELRADGFDFDENVKVGAMIRSQQRRWSLPMFVKETGFYLSD